jgi:hypothetical protein
MRAFPSALRAQRDERNPENVGTVKGLPLLCNTFVFAGITKVIADADLFSAKSMNSVDDDHRGRGLF